MFNDRSVYEEVLAETKIFGEKETDRQTDRTNEAFCERERERERETESERVYLKLNCHHQNGPTYQFNF